MANREIEAILRISSKLGSMTALKTLQKQLKAVNTQAAAYNRAQAVSGKLASSAYMTAARYIGPAAVGYALTKTVKAGAAFEEMLFNIRKKSGGTKEQMEQLRTEIMSLGREIPISLEEIGSSYERGAAAGVPLDKLREYAKLTSRVADAWDMTSADVANSFAGFQAGLGMQGKDLEQFADLINHLADSGIADESGIVEFVDRVGASLKNFGLTPEETAAFGAALENLKMMPEVAARAMDTLAGKLQAPENLSKQSRSALKSIVGDLNDFKKLVDSDASQSLISFFEKLDALPKQKRVSLLGALMGEGFDDEVARMVGGVDEIKRNLAAAQEENKYKGSIAGLSEQKLDLFNSKLEIFQNNIQSAASDAGDLLIGGSGGFLDRDNEAWKRAAAIRAGLKKKNIRGAEYAKFMVLSSQEEKNSMALEGGYGLEVGKNLSPLELPVAPTFPKADLTMLPAPRPVSPAEDPSNGSLYPALPRLEGVPPKLMKFPESKSDYLRRMTTSPMSSATSAFSEKLIEQSGEDIARGGNDAGQSITQAADAIRSAGVDAGASIREAAKSLDAALASARANVMRSAATGNAPAVRADTGKIIPRGGPQ